MYIYTYIYHTWKKVGILASGCRRFLNMIYVYILYICIYIFLCVFICLFSHKIRVFIKCVKNFLQFYEMEGQLLCFTTLWTQVPGVTTKIWWNVRVAVETVRILTFRLIFIVLPEIPIISSWLLFAHDQSLHNSTC